MITKSQIDQCISACSEHGFSDISESDIAYFVLKKEFRDANLAYRIIFGSTEGTSELYEEREDVRFLRSYMNNTIAPSDIVRSKTTTKFSDISFEENKDALVKALEELEDAKNMGEIDYKDALKLEIEIRTKLNDKFKVSDSGNKQFVLVQPRFNHICEWTHKECWLQTKEFAMEHWGLVEK